MAKKAHTLPSNIKEIDIYFAKHELWFHSMVFYGDTKLNIGRTPEDDKELT